MPTLNLPDLEAVYDLLAEAVDRAGAADTERFLAKLTLLLAHELGRRQRFAELVEIALQDL